MMKPTTAILFLMLSAMTTWADGKMYARERVPPDIPYQRALILHNEGQQTLVLQSRFELEKNEQPNSDVGWVVPVPAVPELDSMDAHDAWQLFYYIGMISRPKVTSISEVVLPTLLMFAALWSLIMIVLYGISFFSPKLKAALKIGANRAGCAFYTLVFCFLFTMAIPSFMKARGTSGVDVISAGKVGIYDTAVIRSDSSEALVAWLNENGFQFTDSDLPVIDEYIRKDWCFVVSRVGAGEKADRDPDGLIDPIIMRFASATPVYPLALTATIGVDTEVVIYVVTDQKMGCGEAMERTYAGVFDAERLGQARTGMSGKEYFLPWERELGYLTKFKARLTPEQMEADLEFTPAADQNPYRKRIVRW